MSMINQREFAGSLAFEDPLAYGSSSGGAGRRATLARPSDAISAPTGWNPYQGSSQSQYASPFGDGSYANDGTTGGFGTFVSDLVSVLQNAIAGLSQMFGVGGSNSTSTGTSGANERFVRSATANSVGDPHDSLRGTADDGSSLSQSWDSMTGHADLLDSDSFDGGYRVSTTVTQPNAKGVTLNASATVTAQNGSSRVTFDGDGSYDVESNGSQVALQRGQSVSLGDGERVTLNDDSSLTVSDRNVGGGSLSTTMRANAQGGVDVTNSANQIDLGGYLVNRSDTSPIGGQPPILAPYQPPTPPPSEPHVPYIPFESQTEYSYDGAPIELE